MSFYSNSEVFYVQSLLSKLLAQTSCYSGEAWYKWNDVQDTPFVRPDPRVP